MKRLFAFILSVLLIVSLCSCGYTNDKNCVYCGAVPTKGFETETGKICYVCKSCTSTCKWCGDRATKHYTNLLGNEVFVCNSCYDKYTSD